MKSRIHALAGIAATALVAAFMTATIIVEVIVREKAAILGVKTAILFALIPTARHSTCAWNTRMVPRRSIGMS